MPIDVPRLPRSEVLGRLESLSQSPDVAPVGREALRLALHARIDDAGLHWVLQCAYETAAHLRSAVDFARLVDDVIATPTEVL